VIYVFEGGNTPFIVRETGFENFDANALRNHILIGDCYVHRVMYGSTADSSEVRESLRLQ
jgi:hypothetical protein